MWSSKDVSCIIFLAVLCVVSTALIVQMARLISGIPGANYVFTIILALQTSLSLLIYEGRQWRFFVQMSLFTVLIIPTQLGGPAFFVPGKIHLVITAFLTDFVVNSCYGKFEKQKKLKWWSVLGALLLWVMMPFVSLLMKPLFFTPEYVAAFAQVIILLLPVIIAESIAGGYLGYKIYRIVWNHQSYT